MFFDHPINDTIDVTLVTIEQVAYSTLLWSFGASVRSSA